MQQNIEAIPKSKRVTLEQKKSKLFKDERKEQLVEFQKKTSCFEQEEKKWNGIINPSRRKIFILEDIDIDDDDADVIPGEDMAKFWNRSISLFENTSHHGGLGTNHCVESVRIRSYSGPYFTAFGLNGYWTCKRSEPHHKIQQLALHSRMLILQPSISIKLKPDTKSPVAALGMQTIGKDRSEVLNLSKPWSKYSYMVKSSRYVIKKLRYLRRVFIYYSLSIFTYFHITLTSSNFYKMQGQLTLTMKVENEKGCWWSGGWSSWLRHWQ